jgi:hypothetical protein
MPTVPTCARDIAVVVSQLTEARREHMRRHSLRDEMQDAVESAVAAITSGPVSTLKMRANSKEFA